jgi:hypothetical protein
MWTKEKVKEFANDIGYRHQFTSAELNTLHTILSADEECYGMTEGMLKKIHVNKHSGYGIALLTNQRFLFYHKGFLGSVTIEEFPIDTISSVSLHKGMLLGSLHVYAANVGEVIIEPCDNNNAARIVQAWKHLSGIQKIFDEPIEKQAADSTGELEKWHQLKEKGIITEEEYNSKKKQLLGL